MQSSASIKLITSDVLLKHGQQSCTVKLFIVTSTFAAKIREKLWKVQFSYMVELAEFRCIYQLVTCWHLGRGE